MYSHCFQVPLVLLVIRGHWDCRVSLGQTVMMDQLVDVVGLDNQDPLGSLDYKELG